MSTSTIVLTGTVAIEGVAFCWSVTDARCITVRHPTIGEQTRPLAEDPEMQARTVGRSLLNSATGVAAIGYIDAVDDAPPEHQPDPPTID